MRFFTIPILALCLIFLSCADMGGIDSSSGSGSSSTTPSQASSNLADALSNNAATPESTNDYIPDSTITYIDLTAKTVTGSGAAAFSGNRATISGAGTYCVAGTLSGGMLYVNASDNDTVKIILSNMNLSCSTNSPLLVENAGKTILLLADGTANYFTDGSSYSVTGTDAPNAAVFSRDYLAIGGTGSLTVDGNYTDGITSKDALVIKSGTINVTAEDDGIRGKDALVIHDGTFTLTTSGDGLLSDNTNSGYGYIYIEAGTFTINSAEDGISAKSDVLIKSGSFTMTTGGGHNYYDESTSAKGIKGLASVIIDGGTFSIDAADDALHSNDAIVIINGTYSIASGDDAIHADKIITIQDGSLTITTCEEGIESYAITVNGGTINVTASDDGFNATAGTEDGGTESSDGSCLTINGGTIYVKADADGLDSNGNIVITGGTTAVHGTTGDPEVAMDYNGTAVISGGVLIVTGPDSNMAQGLSDSTQPFLETTFSGSANTLLCIRDSSDNDLIVFKPENSYGFVVFSCPSLVNGSSYKIYTGGSYSGSDSGNGVWTGGTYTPGTLKATVSAQTEESSSTTPPGH